MSEHRTEVTTGMDLCGWAIIVFLTFGMLGLGPCSDSFYDEGEESPYDMWRGDIKHEMNTRCPEKDK